MRTFALGQLPPSAGQQRDGLADEEPGHVASALARPPGATVGRAYLPSAHARRCPVDCRDSAWADPHMDEPRELPSLQGIEAVDLDPHDTPARRRRGPRLEPDRPTRPRLGGSRPGDRQHGRRDLAHEQGQPVVPAGVVPRSHHSEVAPRAQAQSRSQRASVTAFARDAAAVVPEHGQVEARPRACVHCKGDVASSRDSESVKIEDVECSREQPSSVRLAVAQRQPRRGVVASGLGRLEAIPLRASALGQSCERARCISRHRRGLV